MIKKTKINASWKNKTFKTFKTKLITKHLGGAAGTPIIINHRRVKQHSTTNNSAKETRASTRTSTGELTKHYSQISGVRHSKKKNTKNEDYTNSSLFLKMVKSIAENVATKSGDIRDNIISFAQFVNINIVQAAQFKSSSHRSNRSNRSHRSRHSKLEMQKPISVDNFKKAIVILNKIIEIIPNEYLRHKKYVYIFDMANLGESLDRLSILINKITQFDKLNHDTNKLFIIVLHDTISEELYPELSVYNKNIIIINPLCEHTCETDDFIMQLLFQYFYFVADFEKTPANILIISDDLFKWKGFPNCNKGNPILNENNNLIRIDSIPYDSTQYLNNFKYSLGIK